MNFKVISQSTKEREQETIDLFNKAKPYLDDGFSYRLAIIKASGREPNSSFSSARWYDDFMEYADAHGYPKTEYRYKRTRSVADVKEERCIY